MHTLKKSRQYQSIPTHVNMTRRARGMGYRDSTYASGIAGEPRAAGAAFGIDGVGGGPVNAGFEALFSSAVALINHVQAQARSEYRN